MCELRTYLKHLGHALIQSIPKLDEENVISSVISNTDLYVSSTNFTTCSFPTARLLLIYILATGEKVTSYLV